MGIICTKLSGNTPIFPFNSPFHQPLSGSSLLNIVIISPSFKSNSSSLAGLYEYITLHCSRTEKLKFKKTKKRKLNFFSRNVSNRIGNSFEHRVEFESNSQQSKSQNT